MTLVSGTYTILSDAYQKVARLPKNTLNTPIDLVPESGADNESWVVKTFADGTFTVKNKNFSDKNFATSAISSGSKVQNGDGINWKREGSHIIASGLAWEATTESTIVLRAKDPNNANQSFTFTNA